MAALDAKELLHLGLHASEQADLGRAIDYLKQCLALEPDNASATYLLGTLYAQINLYDRAKEVLARAIELDGRQSTAVFQLGLLHLTSGEIEQASRVWQRLDALAGEHCLNLFRNGLLALARDEFGECIQLLERGIESNDINAALNDDMRRVMASAEAARDRAAGPQGMEQGLQPAHSAGSGQYHLGIYRQKSRH